MSALMVALGAALGAPARYLVNQLIAARRGTPIPAWGQPWGTLTVNAIGSFVLGTLAGAALHGRWYALIGTGFCGALTTFSTFAYESDELAAAGKRLWAVTNVAVSLVVGIGLAALGWWLGHALR